MIQRVKVLCCGLLMAALFSGVILVGHEGSPDPCYEGHVDTAQDSADDSMLAAAGKKQQAEAEITQTCSTLTHYNIDISYGDTDSDLGWDLYNTGEAYQLLEAWHDAWHKFTDSKPKYDNATTHYADALQHAKDCTGNCANSNHPY